MIIWLASIESDKSAQVLGVFLQRAALLHSRLITDQAKDHIRVGIASFDGLLSLSVAHQIFTCAEAASANADLKLIWHSSSVETHSIELARLMQRWNETQEPPVLSIVALDLGEQRHVTRGLQMFAGYELAVRFKESETARDAARTLARLAREALINGRILPDRTYEGLAGRALHLEWSGNDEAPPMVTIVL